MKKPTYDNLKRKEWVLSVLGVISMLFIPTWLKFVRRSGFWTAYYELLGQKLEINGSSRSKEVVLSNIVFFKKKTGATNALLTAETLIINISDDVLLRNVLQKSYFFPILQSIGEHVFVSLC